MPKTPSPQCLEKGARARPSPSFPTVLGMPSFPLRVWPLINLQHFLSPTRGSATRIRLSPTHWKAVPTRLFSPAFHIPATCSMEEFAGPQIHLEQSHTFLVTLFNLQHSSASLYPQSPPRNLPHFPQTPTQ